MVAALARIPFKAGDTFNFVGSIPYLALPQGATWAARCWIKNPSSKTRPLPQVDYITATLSAPATSGDDWGITLYRSSTATNLWPRPRDHRETLELVADIEIYDTTSPPVVLTTSSFIIEIEFDPTRAS